MSELRAVAGRKVYVEATLVRDGVAVDTTAASFKAWFTLKETKEDADADAVFAAEIGSGILFNEPSSVAKNKLTVTVTAAATAEYVSATDLVWDLVIDDPASGRGPETIDQGVLKLAAPVTRVAA